MPPFDFPKLRHPLGTPVSTGEPCPAYPICEIVGNARKGCEVGAALPPSTCLAGLILLTARGQGLYTDEMETALKERRQIGFAIQPDSDDKA